MTIFIITIHIIVCLVLILVILLQAGRGSGLSWGSFSGNPQSFFGTKSASILAKATSVSAIVFLFTCIALNVIETRKARSLFTDAKPSQMDVEKIKQVLDQLKESEAAKEGEAAKTQTETSEATPIPDTPPGKLAEETATKTAPAP